MSILKRVALAIVIAAGLTGPAAHAAWPARVFVPYMYLGNSDHFKLTACDDQTGQKFYTLAFIIADAKGNAEPTWYGIVPLETNLYGDQIDAIRRRGGDVICSFGGADGKELAIAETDAAKLEAKYQAVIDRYHFDWLDFDVEGDNLTKHPDANKRRNAALAALQKKNPGLRVTYTLPADPNGISDVSLAVLADAKAQGVSVYSANIMVMYFGRDFIHKGKSEAELGIASAGATHTQLGTVDSAIRVGLCPCIGSNGSKTEIFDLTDATTLLAFAEKTDWVCSMAYWSINRDGMSGKGDDTQTDLPQAPFAFANAFKGFTK